jgi:hypothetical protein
MMVLRAGNLIFGALRELDKTFTASTIENARREVDKAAKRRDMQQALAIAGRRSRHPNRVA